MQAYTFTMLENQLVYFFLTIFQLGMFLSNNAVYSNTDAGKMFYDSLTVWFINYTKLNDAKDV